MTVDKTNAQGDQCHLSDTDCNGVASDSVTYIQSVNNERSVFYVRILL